MVCKAVLPLGQSLGSFLGIGAPRAPLNNLSDNPLLSRITSTVLTPLHLTFQSPSPSIPTTSLSTIPTLHAHLLDNFRPQIGVKLSVVVNDKARERKWRCQHTRIYRSRQIYFIIKVVTMQCFKATRNKALKHRIATNIIIQALYSGKICSCLHNT